MAETILTEVIVKLTCVITENIANKIKLQKGVSRGLESIKNELQIITAFLKDAEDRAERSDLVKAWVSQVRDVAYKIEDVIDEHVMLTYVHRLQNQPNNPCLRLCMSIPCIVKKLKLFRDISTSIAHIKAEVFEIQQRKTSYGLLVRDRHDMDMDMDTDTDANMQIWRDPRVSFLYPRDSDLVGIEDPKNEILELLDLEGKDSKCLVISIVGTGGVGKTTLAWKVYDNVEVTRHFYVRAWVNVTQFYSRKDVLRSMLRGLYKSAMQPTPNPINEMDEMSLIGELRNFLQDKRYMVVFDDVWDTSLWNHVKSAFPDDYRGSRVLLTTRHDIVGLAWKGSWVNNCVYRLKLLCHEKAWELFCNKAFHGQRSCPQLLEDISHSIVNKCDGLPLALVTLGALLSTKAHDLEEWKTFRDCLSIELAQNPQLSNISRILLLSYKGLPHFLKPCLLYLGLFPESCFIERNRLLNLWIAEDFIQWKGGIEVEQVAQDYLLELIQRNLIQISTRYDCGRIRTLRVHDLVHEALRQKLGELKLCQILTKKENHHQVNPRSRRLTIEKDRANDALRSIQNTTGKCTIRSILLFGTQELLAPSQILLCSSLLKKVYLLKVLDLQGACIEQIPPEVGDLCLLQYLSLRYTKVRSVPKTIGKLVNLLTLDLKRCPVFELPVEVGSLQKLRNLIVYQNTWHNTNKRWEIGAIAIPKGALRRLESLQKLADVNVATTIDFIDQLGTFRMLKYLGISNVTRENSWTLCKAIEKLSCLESLNISVDYNSHDPLDLRHVTSPPLRLQRIYLIGPLETFPKWIKRLKNLKKLRFRGSKLNDIPLDILRDLPNLKMLGISEGVHYGERLVFKVGGFNMLKAMYLDSLRNLKSIEIQHGALPCLEDLMFRRSPQLKEVPVGLRFLQKLNCIRVVEMPEEFVSSISSNPEIVKHVKDIRVGYQTSWGHYIFKKL